MQRCTPRRNIVCAPAQVCLFACVHRCIFVYTCARVCQCVHICITLARVTWGRIVHILWLRFPPAQRGPLQGGTPVPPPAGAAPAGGGRWGRVTELGILYLALRWKAAPPLGISLITLMRLQGPSSCVSLAYEQLFGGRVTRYGDNSVGRK